MTDSILDTNRKTFIELSHKIADLRYKQTNLFNEMFEDVTPIGDYSLKVQMAQDKKAKYIAHNCEIGDYRG